MYTRSSSKQDDPKSIILMPDLLEAFSRIFSEDREEPVSKKFIGTSLYLGRPVRCRQSGGCRVRALCLCFHVREHPVITPKGGGNRTWLEIAVDDPVLLEVAQ